MKPRDSTRWAENLFPKLEEKTVSEEPRLSTGLRSYTNILDNSKLTYSPKRSVFGLRGDRKRLNSGSLYRSVLRPDQIAEELPHIEPFEPEIALSGDVLDIQHLEKNIHGKQVKLTLDSKLNCYCEWSQRMSTTVLEEATIPNLRIGRPSTITRSNALVTPCAMYLTTAEGITHTVLGFVGLNEFHGFSGIILPSKIIEEMNTSRVPREFYIDSLLRDNHYLDSMYLFIVFDRNLQTRDEINYGQLPLGESIYQVIVKFDSENSKHFNDIPPSSLEILQDWVLSDDRQKSVKLKDCFAIINRKQNNQSNDIVIVDDKGIPLRLVYTQGILSALANNVNKGLEVIATVNVRDILERRSAVNMLLPTHLTTVAMTSLKKSPQKKTLSFESLSGNLTSESFIITKHDDIKIAEAKGDDEVSSVASPILPNRSPLRSRGSDGFYNQAFESWRVNFASSSECEVEVKGDLDDPVESKRTSQSGSNVISKRTSFKLVEDISDLIRPIRNSSRASFSHSVIISEPSDSPRSSNRRLLSKPKSLAELVAIEHNSNSEVKSPSSSYRVSYSPSNASLSPKKPHAINQKEQACFDRRTFNEMMISLQSDSNKDFLGLNLWCCQLDSLTHVILCGKILSDLEFALKFENFTETELILNGKLEKNEKEWIIKGTNGSTMNLKQNPSEMIKGVTWEGTTVYVWQNLVDADADDLVVCYLSALSNKVSLKTCDYRGSKYYLTLSDQSTSDFIYLITSDHESLPIFWGHIKSSEFLPLRFTSKPVMDESMDKTKFSLGHFFKAFNEKQKPVVHLSDDPKAETNEWSSIQSFTEEDNLIDLNYQVSFAESIEEEESVAMGLTWEEFVGYEKTTRLRIKPKLIKATKLARRAMRKFKELYEMCWVEESTEDLVTVLGISVEADNRIREQKRRTRHIKTLGDFDRKYLTTLGFS